MTLAEKELLTRFLQQLASANAGQKDPEAEALIKDAVGRQPDAGYLLTQRALQLEQLLQASQEQVKALQSELEQARTGTSRGFLQDSNAWGSRPAPIPAAQQPFGVRNFGSRNSPGPQGGSWATGLFGNIAATAAGVVAGSFLFQGLQGLMNGDETATVAGNAPSLDTLQPAEPELLNSFDTVEGESGDMFADLDDSGDFA